MHTGLTLQGELIEQAPLMCWWYERAINIEEKFEAFFDKYIEQKNKNRNKADQKDPDGYRCITSQAVFVEPVRASDNFTYSKKGIEDWWRTKMKSGDNFTSPMTRAELTYVLTPNAKLANEINLAIEQYNDDFTENLYVDSIWCQLEQDKSNIINTTHGFLGECTKGARALERKLTFMAYSVFPGKDFVYKGKYVPIKAHEQLEAVIRSNNKPIEDYKCAITQTFYKEPVIASDGEIYEKEALEVWYNEKIACKEIPKSPLTGDNLLPVCFHATDLVNKINEMIDNYASNPIPAP